MLLKQKINWANPTTITLGEWFSGQREGGEIDYYSNEYSKEFHRRSVNKLNSINHFVDYRKLEIKENHTDGRYFDDLSFKEELNEKEILIDFKRFLLQHTVDSIEKETMRKLLWIINEIERNIRNHAFTDESDLREYSYCGNYYEKEDKMIINISDYGIGFEGRREENDSYTFLFQAGIEDEEDYLLKAIEPKITTYTNRKKVSNEGNTNSGYGLYMLNTIGSHRLNKLEILTNGKLYVNDFYTNKMKFVAKYPEFDGITSISIHLKIGTLDEVFDKLSKDANAFSSKSNFTKSIYDIEL